MPKKWKLAEAFAHLVQPEKINDGVGQRGARTVKLS